MKWSKHTVVEESKWYRGHGSKNSKLLNENGMCCLGFWCVQSGWKEDKIRGVGSPNWLPGLLPTKLQEFCMKAENINDNQTISDEVRKVHLTELWEKNGMTIEFKP